MDSARAFHEFLFAQLAVLVLVEHLEQACGIGHLHGAARRGRGRSRTVGPPITIALGRTVMTSTGFRPT
jgi:hypothetical protein